MVALIALLATPTAHAFVVPLQLVASDDNHAMATCPAGAALEEVDVGAFTYEMRITNPMHIRTVLASAADGSAALRLGEHRKLHLSGDATVDSADISVVDETGNWQPGPMVYAETVAAGQAPQEVDDFISITNSAMGGAADLYAFPVPLIERSGTGGGADWRERFWNLPLDLDTLTAGADPCSITELVIQIQADNTLWAACGMQGGAGTGEISWHLEPNQAFPQLMTSPQLVFSTQRRLSCP